MRVSRHFNEAERTGNRPASLPANFTPKSERFATTTCCGPKLDSSRAGVAVPKSAQTTPRQWGPPRCWSPQEPALPAGKTRKKTSPAKSCSPRNVRFRGFALPASVEPAFYRSRHDDRVRRAGCLWLHAPNLGTTSRHCSAAQTSASREPITKSSLISRHISHKWDFSGFRAQLHTAAFLYLLPDATGPGISMNLTGGIALPVGIRRQAWQER